MMFLPDTVFFGYGMLLPTAREDNVFRSICQSFCSQGGGGLPSGQRSQTDRDPLGQTPQLDRDPPLDRVAVTAVVNTHPTGMHSCCMDCFHMACFHIGLFFVSGVFAWGVFTWGVFTWGVFA